MTRHRSAPVRRSPQAALRPGPTDSTTAMCGVDARDRAIRRMQIVGCAPRAPEHGRAHEAVLSNTAPRALQHETLLQLSR